MKRTYRTIITREQFNVMTDYEKFKIVRSLLRSYEAHTASEMVCVGFIYKKRAYYAFIPKVKPSWCRLYKASGSNVNKTTGSFVKVNMVLNNPEKEYILSHYDCIEFDPAILKVEENRGKSFEKFITETYTDEVWKADRIGFWVQGDVRINGKEVQIKFAGAQIVTEQTIYNRSWLKD